MEILVDVPWWTVGCEEEEYKKCYVEAGVILLQWSFALTNLYPKKIHYKILLQEKFYILFVFSEAKGNLNSLLYWGSFVSRH